MYKIDTYKEEIENAANSFKARYPNDFLVDPINSKMREDQKNSGITYNVNSKNFRSDEFIKEHKRKHILFAGCSNTFGEGIEYEKVWSYRIYEKINKSEELSGYFNLGASGSSIFEILINVNRYIRKYSFPDVIFLLLPEIERDIRYFNSPKICLAEIICELYNQLELLCKVNNTKLLATSWMNLDEESLSKKYFAEDRFLQVKTRDNKYAKVGFYKDLSDINPYSQLKKLENNSLTFKTLSEEDITQDMYKYSLENKKNKNLFIAADSGKHHGEAFHYAWSENLYNRYINE